MVDDFSCKFPLVVRYVDDFVASYDGVLSSEVDVWVMLLNLYKSAMLKYCVEKDVVRDAI